MADGDSGFHPIDSMWSWVIDKVTPEPIKVAEQVVSDPVGTISKAGSDAITSGLTSVADSAEPVLVNKLNTDDAFRAKIVSFIVQKEGQQIDGVAAKYLHTGQQAGDPQNAPDGAYMKAVAFTLNHMGVDKASTYLADIIEKSPKLREDLVRESLHEAHAKWDQYKGHVGTGLMNAAFGDNPSAQAQGSSQPDPLEGLLTATIHKSPSLKAEFAKQFASDTSKDVIETGVALASATGHKLSGWMAELIPAASASTPARAFNAVWGGTPDASSNTPDAQTNTPAKPQAAAATGSDQSDDGSSKGGIMGFLEGIPIIGGIIKFFEMIFDMIGQLFKGMMGGGDSPSQSGGQPGGITAQQQPESPVRNFVHTAERVMQEGETYASNSVHKLWDNITGISQNEKFAVGFLQGKGLSAVAASGVVANIKHESNFNEHVMGDHGTSGGLVQLHNERLTRMLQWTGKPDLAHTTKEDQLNYINYELTQGDYRDLGRRMQTASNAQVASDMFTREFEKPANVNERSAERCVDAQRICDAITAAPRYEVASTTNPAQSQSTPKLTAASAGGGFQKPSNQPSV